MLAGMFAHSDSSTMALASRVMKQTLLDSFSTPSIRLSRKEAEASQNEGQAGHMMEETTCGASMKLPKTCTAKEEQLCLEDTPSPSPTPPEWQRAVTHPWMLQSEVRSRGM